MIARRLLLADASLSLALHGLKVLVALTVNWIVLNHFSVSDFVTWSVTSSVLIVATASDLGIGQYTVTRLINVERSEWSKEVGEGFGALLPLALIAAAFVLFAIKGPSLSYKVAMAGLLTLRIATIPFAATLNAANQFKIRKAIELGAYALAAAAIGAIAATSQDIHAALLALNASFLLGALATTVVASRYAPILPSFKAASVRNIDKVLRAAGPFMANNLTGLLTYGGFIWLSSLVLPKSDVAVLAVLHGFVLINLYQVYDVFLKARQANLIDPDHVAPLKWINLLVMVAIPPLFALFGRDALSIFGNPVPINKLTAVLFGILMAFELGNLFVQSVTQVNKELSPKLSRYAALRLALLAPFAAAPVIPDSLPKLPIFLAMLSLVSLSTFNYLRMRTRHIEGRHKHSSEHMARSSAKHKSGNSHA